MRDAFPRCQKMLTVWIGPRYITPRRTLTASRRTRAPVCPSCTGHFDLQLGGHMRTFLGALVCSLLLAPSYASAQSEATLTGTVKDTSGAVIPGATITARHVATN